MWRRQRWRQRPAAQPCRHGDGQRSLHGAAGRPDTPAHRDGKGRRRRHRFRGHLYLELRRSEHRHGEHGRAGDRCGRRADSDHRHQRGGLRKPSHHRLGDDSAAAPPPPGTDTPALQQIVSGLKFPTGLVSPPGDTRLFVLLKAGPIRIIKDGVLLPTAFLDLTTKVSSTAGEQGLLGLAFPPDYATSGRFFVHYNDHFNTNRVSSYRVAADPDQG